MDMMCLEADDRVKMESGDEMDMASASTVGAPAANAQEGKKDPQQKPPKPRAGGGGEGGRGGKKHGAKCPGCAKSLSGEQFPASSRFCYSCTLVKDRLYKAAARKGDVGWLRDQLSGDVSAKKLMDYYRKQTGSNSGVRLRDVTLLFPQCVLVVGEISKSGGLRA